mmetsp:Transcript_19135/g.73193  ORF Transcript_19135/g.73193 Transcript_19135/m.73193 type:complete len:276 (+) Transcript_19135:1031-1858(+)
MGPDLVACRRTGVSVASCLGARSCMLCRRRLTWPRQHPQKTTKSGRSFAGLPRQCQPPSLHPLQGQSLRRELVLTGTPRPLAPPLLGTPKDLQLPLSQRRRRAMQADSQPAALAVRKLMLVPNRSLALMTAMLPAPTFTPWTRIGNRRAGGARRGAVAKLAPQPRSGRSTVTPMLELPPGAQASASAGGLPAKHTPPQQEPLAQKGPRPPRNRPPTTAITRRAKQRPQHRGPARYAQLMGAEPVRRQRRPATPGPLRNQPRRRWLWICSSCPSGS